MPALSPSPHPRNTVRSFGHVTPSVNYYRCNSIAILLQRRGKIKSRRIDVFIIGSAHQIAWHCCDVPDLRTVTAAAANGDAVFRTPNVYISADDTHQERDRRCRRGLSCNSISDKAESSIGRPRLLYRIMTSSVGVVLLLGNSLYGVFCFRDVNTCSFWRSVLQTR